MDSNQPAPDSTSVTEDVAVADPDASGGETLDASSSDPDAASTVSCLQRTDIPCAAPEDCVVADKGSMVCVDGNCHEQDFTPNATAQECCNAQYAAGNYAAPGCNPWGPPAPPVDRGYRLADFARGMA